MVSPAAKAMRGRAMEAGPEARSARRVRFIVFPLLGRPGLCFFARNDQVERAASVAPVRWEWLSTAVSSPHTSLLGLARPDWPDQTGPSASGTGNHRKSDNLSGQGERLFRKSCVELPRDCAFAPVAAQKLSQCWTFRRNETRAPRTG